VALDGTPIKVSTVFKYLGVILDNHLSFNGHINYVAAKVSHAETRHSFKSEAESANRLYKSMILPFLEYCDITWHGCGHENQKKIASLQRRAGRIVLKNSQELISDAIIGRLGWKPLSERREEHIKDQESPMGILTGRSNPPHPQVSQMLARSCIYTNRHDERVECVTQYI